MRMFWNNPIKVHCWGGFGSQLYALTLAHELKSRYASREICLIFHTGGITLRNPEILKLVGDFSYQIENDFVAQNIALSPRSKFRPLVKKFLLSIAVLFGFVARGNSDKEFSRIRPWVQTLRGHYCYRSQNRIILHKVFHSYLQNLNEDRAFIGVQYRLGDLTTLENKPPIDSIRISNLIRRINILDVPIKIYSDSPNDAISRLSANGIKGFPVERTSLDTVLDLYNAQIFIGTSSKISFWVTILRNFFDNESNSYMPISNMKQLKLNIGSNSTLVKFY